MTKSRPPRATVKGISSPSSRKVIVMTPSASSHVTPVPAPPSSIPDKVQDPCVSLVPSPERADVEPVPSAFNVSFNLNAEGTDRSELGNGTGVQGSHRGVETYQVVGTGKIGGHDVSFEFGDTRRQRGDVVGQRRNGAAARAHARGWALRKDRL